MSYTAMLLAGAMLIGQPENDPVKKPECNPHLTPLAWMIGQWEAEKRAPTGELLSIRRNTISWTPHKQAILLENSITGPDGTTLPRATALIHWDNALQKARIHIVTADGMTVEGSTIRLDDADVLCHVKRVYPGGDQGHYKRRSTYDREAETWTWGAVKISGLGSNEAGPVVFTRVKK